MAGREEEEVVDLGQASPEDVERFRRRMTNLVRSAYSDDGGTVQKNRWPDAWAWVIVLALVASAVALGFAVADGTASMGIATPLAVLSLALALVGVGLKSVQR